MTHTRVSAPQRSRSFDGSPFSAAAVAIAASTSAAARHRSGNRSSESGRRPTCCSCCPREQDRRRDDGDPEHDGHRGDGGGDGGGDVGGGGSGDDNRVGDEVLRRPSRHARAAMTGRVAHAVTAAWLVACVAFLVPVAPPGVHAAWVLQFFRFVSIVVYYHVSPTTGKMHTDLSVVYI